MARDRQAEELIQRFRSDEELLDALFAHYHDIPPARSGVYRPSVAADIVDGITHVELAIRSRVARFQNLMERDGLTEWPPTDHNPQTEYRVLSPLGREVYLDGTYRDLILGQYYTYRTKSKAVVFIESADKRGTVGGGTAIRITDDWFLTCAHCLPDGASRHLVEFGKEETKNHALADPVTDSDKDLAVFRCPGFPGSVTLSVAPTRADVLEPVLVLHYPDVPQRHRCLVATSGEINAVLPNYQRDRDFLMISTRTAPGSSGGAVLDRRGRLVGVAAELVFDAESTDPSDEATAEARVAGSFFQAIPSDVVCAFLQEGGISG